MSAEPCEFCHMTDAANLDLEREVNEMRGVITEQERLMAEHCVGLNAEIDRLKADLARVEGERDAMRDALVMIRDVTTDGPSEASVSKASEYAARAACACHLCSKLQSRLAEEAKSAPLLGRCFLLAHGYLNAIQMGTCTTDLDNGTSMEKATWRVVHEYFEKLRQEAEPAALEEETK